MSNTPLTFVIGDIHGMYAAYKTVKDLIALYISKNNIEDYKIIFLGDYIDRGPDSDKVVHDIYQEQLNNPERIITLRGNHEQMLLDAMNGGFSDLSLFMMNGGKETLKSYGVENLSAIPFDHKQFFRETRHCYQDNLRYYVHAGINPFRKLNEQTDNDRLWIREGFLDAPGPFEKFIVHGHTPRPYDTYGNLQGKNRLNLDFAAVFGGALVCAIFNDCDMEPIDYITGQTGSRPGPL